ncbi:hypothetical protein [Clostridium argentinense]|uniref:hypothetical protein n=1 Tax=Clostridium argentinense TaxID=29341 RepID=UPI00057DF730|nr:hypothetical protein [Clostridium argentinense]ARC85769.1 hypothetical protein RSJ17_15360 [Clostridium argentinense]NFF39851.1 hypothetical protein [Clostridium argentinense]NFP51046.1 hypothetical protein [Clostridium argentinense]NFP73178.1 hypothetical protein [Clostridium argentinense]NFP77699.1 hypothetical protein [Clostridium argentinense]
MWCCNELLLLILLLILLDDEDCCRPRHKIKINNGECKSCNKCNDDENDCGNIIIYSNKVNIFKV